MSQSQQPFQPPRPVNPQNVYGPRATSSTFSRWGAPSGQPVMPGRSPEGPQGMATPARAPQLRAGQGAQPAPAGQPGQSAHPGLQAPQHPSGPQFHPGTPAPAFAPVGAQPQGASGYGAPGQGLLPPQGPQLQPQQGYGMPPQGPYGPAWQPQPPKRQRPVGLIIAVAVAALALVGLLILVLTTGHRGGGGGDFQNEDYEVPSTDVGAPPLPEPKSDAELIQMYEDSTLYQQTLASPVRCEVGFKEGVADLSDAELEEHLQSFLGCLTRVWGPSLEEAGFEIHQPKLTVFPAGGKVNTKCGTAESMNAFYCAGDQNIYLAPDIMKIVPAEFRNSRGIVEMIMAHEFGHYVQGRTGILYSAVVAQVEKKEGNDKLAYEMLRRGEVQADCFGGTGVNSLSQSMELNDDDRRAMEETTFAIGDDNLSERAGVDYKPDQSDHGNGKNRKMWLQRGLDTSDMAQCNTFKAPSEEVA